MEKDGWKSPATVIATLALVVSLCGTYIQYINNQDQIAQQAHNNEEQLNQERAKWEEERLKTRAEEAKLEAELNDLKEREAYNRSDRQALISGLNEINKNIAEWNRFIASKQSSRETAFNIGTNYGRAPLRESEAQEINKIDNEIADAQKKKSDLVARRHELESYLFAITPK